MRFVCLVLLLCVAASAHDRWIGTWEEESGKGELYEFVFQPDGVLQVEKSTGIALVRQSFQWKDVAGSIAIRGDAGGAIPELSTATLRKVGDNRFVCEISDKQSIKVRRSFPVVSWLHLAFLFAVLFLGNELCRKYKVAAYVTFFVLPFALIPLFETSGFDSVFRWTKLYSAVAGGIFFTLFRFNGIDKYRWAKITVAVILAINILEACVQDFTTGNLPNILNAAAGVLNIVTISRALGIRRDDAAPHDMLWPGMTIGWIVAYDIWNITFVYLNFPNTVAFTALAVITAPTLAAMFVKKGSWMQARAYTLAIYMIYIFSFKSMADNYLNLQFNVPLPRSEGIVMGLALLSLGSNVVYAILHYRWRFTGKAPDGIEVGQNASVI